MNQINIKYAKYLILVCKSFSFIQVHEQLKFCFILFSNKMQQSLTLLISDLSAMLLLCAKARSTNPQSVPILVLYVVSSP